MTKLAWSESSQLAQVQRVDSAMGAFTAGVRTGDPVGSIPRGIAQSASLVTGAALILATSFAVYATSQVSFLQQLGIGMALAVAVDATIIRGLLLPASMRLAGRANWWAPTPLRRLHHRGDLRIEECVTVTAPPFPPVGARTKLS